MINWVKGKIIKIKYHTELLFSLIVHSSVSLFIAGQFTKIGLLINNKKIYRAYSYVNKPFNNNLEFYFIIIPNGILSSMLYTLKSGDNIMLSKQSTGIFILDKIPMCDSLWMISTGTGIGPYLSILNQKKKLEQFKNIILVNSVRYIKDFSYISTINNLKNFYGNKLRVQLLISRENNEYFLKGRIPNLILNGLLELSVGLRINFKNSHVMLCGNPNMIYDTQELLKKTRGMNKNFKNKLGHVTSEQYW